MCPIFLCLLHFAFSTLRVLDSVGLYPSLCDNQFLVLKIHGPLSVLVRETSVNKTEIMLHLPFSFREKANGSVHNKNVVSKTTLGDDAVFCESNHHPEKGLILVG